jgi:hypothetical protein
MLRALAINMVLVAAKHHLHRKTGASIDPVVHHRLITRCYSLASTGDAQPMYRWKKIRVSLGILVIASVAYLWFFGTQTFFALEALNVARKLPFVKRTPVVLSDVAVSQESGMNLSYFGYDFEVPWTD